MICPNCGAVNDQGSKKCSNCNYDFQADTIPTSPVHTNTSEATPAPGATNPVASQPSNDPTGGKTFKLTPKLAAKIGAGLVALCVLFAIFRLFATTPESFVKDRIAYQVSLTQLDDKEKVDIKKLTEEQKLNANLKGIKTNVVAENEPAEVNKQIRDIAQRGLRPWLGKLPNSFSVSDLKFVEIKERKYGPQTSYILLAENNNKDLNVAGYMFHVLKTEDGYLLESTASIPNAYDFQMTRSMIKSGTAF